MLVEHTVVELRKRIQRWRGIHQKVALVPTMGNLHAGHIALVKRARELADRVVVSIFVNPTQFGPKEDFAAYPRTPDADRLQLAVAGVDLLFTPEVDEVYPGGMEQITRVEVPALAGILEGASRPAHFTGVATVVNKLFNMVQPDVAVFGEKDYQQLSIIRRMAADLCMPVEIVGAPTVRESDGLAMSSRNQYLSAEERRIAPWIFAELTRAAGRLEAGESDYAVIEHTGREALEVVGLRPEYFSVRAKDLSVPAAGAKELVVLAAARLGRARLIDNVQVTR